MLAQLLIRAAATSASGFVFNATISADTTDYNLRAAAIAAGWNQTSPVAATVTVNSGIVVSGTSAAGCAFDTGTSFPVGSELKLINNGFICGMGGKGGDAYTAPSNAQAGGTALRAQHAIQVTNNGTIAGGGGGGGGSAGGSRGGGGGRSGRVSSAGGNATWDAAVSAGTFASGGQGGGGGAGGAGGTTGEGIGGNGYGGGGGGWGARGGFGDYSHDYSTSGAYGGASVVGNSNITWLATGTRYGSIT